MIDSMMPNVLKQKVELNTFNMRHFKFKVSSEFEEPIDNIISCLLPHENFDVDEAKGVIEELSRTLPVEETSGVYFIFLTIIDRLSVTRLYMKNRSTVLSREVFEHAVLGGLRDILLLEDFDAVTFFGEYSKNYDLSIPTQFEDATAFAYSVLMEKYDELFEKAIPTQQGLSWLTILKQNLNYALTAKMLSVAAATLTEGRQQGRTVSRGPDEARKFLTEALADVNSRVQNIFSDTNSRFTETSITSLEVSKMFDEKNRIKARPLYYMGVDPIDDVMPVRTQDIVTIVADEGIGKTRFAIDQAYRAIRAGVNVLYICGETAQIKIKKSIESAHCYSLYQLQLRWSEVDDPSTITDISTEALEELQIKINAAQADLYENKDYGRIIFEQSATYENFLETIKGMKDKHSIDLVIVDHVLALTSDGSVTTLGRLNTKSMRVSYLYECEDILVKECNIAFLNTSHPSSITSKDLKEGRSPGARSGAESSDSTKYSSVVCVLNNTPELRKQDIVLMYITKLRDEPNTADACVLQRMGFANIHVFDPKLQYLGSNGKNNDNDVMTALFMDEED